MEDIEKLERLGNIKIDDKRCIVAFLDVLGFKSHVKDYLNGNKSILKVLKNAFKESTKYFDEEYDPIFKFTGLKVKYNQFSDCIYFSFPNFKGDSEIAAILFCAFIYSLRSFYFNIITTEEVYIRGGISVGFHYEDENIIFSEGLIKAHELESKKAMYSRIILDDELINRFKKLWENQKETMSVWEVDKILVSDEDGTIFINPFTIAQTSENRISAGIEKIPHYFNKNKSIKDNLIEIDYNAQKRVLENLDKKIKKLRIDEEDNYVITKYLWLKEFVKWNIDPESSEIRFDYLLK